MSLQNAGKLRRTNPVTLGEQPGFDCSAIARILRKYELFSARVSCVGTLAIGVLIAIGVLMPICVLIAIGVLIAIDVLMAIGM
jgi:hypothetical protein